ncbi:MAG: hypothetical protein OXP66_17225, partial [Candidatus Tectomicrobia bacterium]|nr:hypothetical protein [Candidatus Tectomicrobia bacterium]
AWSTSLLRLLENCFSWLSPPLAGILINFACYMCKPCANTSHRFQLPRNRALESTGRFLPVRLAPATDRRVEHRVPSQHKLFQSFTPLVR